MTTPRPVRILLCVVGVGAGNTTRNLAILELLKRQPGCEILVAAQGKAHDLLAPHYKTVALQTVGYSSTGSFSAFDIVKNNLGFPRRFFENQRRIAGIIAEFKPDLVLADSDFYCLAPARRAGVRLVSLNNSQHVIESIKRMGGAPRNCAFSYYCIEKTDCWLQDHYPDRVLAPVFRPIEGLPRKTVQIPPILRPGITPVETPGEEILVLTGGSGIGSAPIDLRALEGRRVRTLGTPLPLAPPDAIQMGFQLDLEPLLRQARVIVTQGGFSSTSEIVGLRLPAVVVPIANHAEQWANAREIERLGLGIHARTGADTGRAVLRALDEYDRLRARHRELALPVNGAERAAELLWKWASEGF